MKGLYFFSKKHNFLTNYSMKDLHDVSSCFNMAFKKGVLYVFKNRICVHVEPPIFICGSLYSDVFVMFF